jgi:5-methylthioribose kinase
MLGRIHSRSAKNFDQLASLADTTVFFELRVDPFYRRIAEVHSPIQAAICDVIAEMAAHPLCLVHGDFSPKNMLVRPDGVTLVDHETVHRGDPAFDLGFFFSHLWLKAIAFPASRAKIAAGIDAAWQEYQAELTTAVEIPIEPLTQRAVRHLAACLLSRVDGKSTVDYLREESHRTFVREVSLEWLAVPPENLTSAFQGLHDRLEVEQGD